MSIGYKSFCWTVGTTSFRVNQLNRKIESQLQCLSEFWADDSYKGRAWSEKGNGVQSAYYQLLQKRGLTVGDAPNPAKDAREKTSALVELGLVDAERRLTAAGARILAIAAAGDFRVDTSNLLDLPKDSYQYFLQLLKATKPLNGGCVRPFIIFIYVLSQIVPDSERRTYLKFAEFVNLLPMCVDVETTRQIIEKINAARHFNLEVNVDEIIAAVLLGMENYQQALSVLRAAKEVDEDLICLIGLNRKSGAKGGKRYDAPYLQVFKTLHTLVFEGLTQERTNSFLAAVGACPLKASWLKYFFVRKRGARPSQGRTNALRLELAILKAKTEDAFRFEFFKILHLLKAKATFKDYADLNRRYFKLADVAIFNEGTVELDALPKCFVGKIAKWLEQQSFCACSVRQADISLEQIITTPLPSKDELVFAATGLTAGTPLTGDEVRKVLRERRYARFRALLHEKFPKEAIIRILTLIENRANDSEVRRMVTDNADIPTIFEYIIALAWYYVSGEEGAVLDYMKLSLGSDFLPKSHASGGEADIVWEYAQVPDKYPAHALLIEVTLTEKTSQRRMEMEPVSRHLGLYKLAHSDEDATYCTFVTTYLDSNVLSDFRGRKNLRFYDPADSNRHIDGMKIVPLDTRMLREMLSGNLLYPSLYKIFEDYHNREGDAVVLHKELREIIAQAAAKQD